jgi:two-component system sensor histidine kinase/response regulator
MIRYLAIYGLLAGLVGGLLYLNARDREAQYLQQHVIGLETAYGAVVRMYALATETLYTETIQQPDVLALFRRGVESAGDARDLARGLLYRRLAGTYEALKQRKLKQFHFHLADGTSFLRFHQPDRYGDPLFDKRESVRLANTRLERVSGFETGRVAHGFRYVFPIVDQGRHLGSVETSVTFKAIQQELGGLVPGSHFAFLLSGQAVFPGLFESERSIYTASGLHPDYWYEDLGIKGGEATPPDPLVQRLNEGLAQRDAVRAGLDAARGFALGTRLDGVDYAVSFVPVSEVSGRHAAYLIGYAAAPLLGAYRTDLFIQWTVAALALALLVAVTRQFLRGRDALRRSADRTALVVAGADLGLWDWDVVSGRVVFNDRWARMLGYRPEELDGSVETWKSLVHPEDLPRVTEALQAHLDGLAPVYETEHRLRTRAGAWCWVLDRGRVLERDAEGRPLRAAGTHLDITERKRTQEQLERARDEAVAANLAKSQFLSSMSHELRTPLNAVLGFGQLLDSDPDEPLAPGQRDSVREIIKAGQHLLELINQVLDLAKIEAGRLDVSMEAVSVTEVLRECLTLVTPLADQHGIRLRVDPAWERGLWAEADRTRLKQVLLNLLSNGIKYNTAGGEVLVGAPDARQDWLCIPVRDTGPGLAEDHLEQVFQPFTRIGQEGGSVEGTGIGLTIARELAQRMGGDLTATSRLGVGSEFIVRLRRCGPPEQAGTGDGPLLPEPAVAPVAGGPMHTVLYVEDNPANLKLVELILRRRPDLQLLSAPNATLGLELAAGHRPDLILLDINLPGMNGYEMLERLHADPALADTPVIAVSANALSRDVAQGLEAGFLAYLTKPIRVRELLDVLDTYLP